MPLVVQKFGGTSVASAARMREVADHVKHCRSRGDQIVLVVSAMGSETDELIGLADQITDEPSGREMDMLITAGERKAIALMCMALHDVGVAADSFTGSQAGFLTDTNHRNAKILSVTPKRVTASLEAGRVAVVAGAQGVSTDNDVTFLGRGGSDTTAVALAHGLGADACELYTDVSGVFTTDPRVCTRARKLARISFDELLEMTAMGCPKPAARSVEVARTYGVPLHVRSAFTWEPGTWVVDPESGMNARQMEQPIVTGIVPDASQAKVTLVGVRDEPGIAAKVFRTLADAAVERRHDCAERGRSRTARTSRSRFRPRAPKRSGSHLRGHGGQRRLLVGQHRCGHREGLARRCRHGQPSRRSRHHVRDAGL